MIDQLTLKLKAKIKDITENVEKYGYERFSTCDHYNWDKDYYNFRYSIVEKLRNEGYNVYEVISHGVIDFTITKKLKL